MPTKWDQMSLAKIQEECRQFHDDMSPLRERAERLQEDELVKIVELATVEILKAKASDNREQIFDYIDAAILREVCKFAARDIVGLWGRHKNGIDPFRQSALIAFWFSKMKPLVLVRGRDTKRKLSINEEVALRLFFCLAALFLEEEGEKQTRYPADSIERMTHFMESKVFIDVIAFMYNQRYGVNDFFFLARAVVQNGG